MNFDRFDLITTLARDHQQTLIEEAAERRLIRLARESHPSRGRLARVFRTDPAS